MEKEFTEVYCGSGKGKTTLAVGQCLRASANGKSVIIIQFLKGKERQRTGFSGGAGESGYQDFPV